MKIKIADQHEFSILGIHWEYNDERPIDISIYGSERVLSEIAELVHAGSAILEITPSSSEEMRMIERGATHVCLFGRLPKFVVVP